MATALYVILTVCVPVLVAVVGLVLVQRLVPPDRREEHNDVAGFIYAVLGVAYAVLLAFMLISVWQDYNKAQTNVESEAHELAGVYFLTSRLPEPERTQMIESKKGGKTMLWPLCSNVAATRWRNACSPRQGSLPT